MLKVIAQPYFEGSVFASAIWFVVERATHSCRSTLTIAKAGVIQIKVDKKSQGSAV